MRDKNRISNTLPRLFIEKSDDVAGDFVGYLQVNNSQEKMEIGTVGSREFRLLQCLFSPKNFLSAKYEPVIQTYERIFAAIGMSSDALNARLFNSESAESEMIRIVEKTLRKLQSSKVTECFSFIYQGGRVRMEAVAAV